MTVAHSFSAPDVAPHNIEAEQQLLGAVLLNNAAYGMVAGVLSPDDFYEPIHSRIYEECGRQIIAGHIVTPITLKSAFPEIDIGGLKTSQYLAHLAAEATTVINAPDFAAIIHDLAAIRSLIDIGRGLASSRERLYAPNDALREAFEQIDSLRATRSGTASERATMETLAQAMIARMQSDAPDEKEASVSTGFTDIDRQLGGGYRDGRLFVLAGRPGAGKTVFAVASSRRVARAGYGALIFSLEMPRNDIMARFAASELAHTDTPIEYRDILVGDLDESQRRRVAEAATHLQPLPIVIDTTVGLSIAEISARARIVCERWRRAGIKPGLIAIDYLGLVRTSDRYRGNKVNEQGEIALGGKLMAGQLETCVLLLAQLNRGVESRDDKRPVMSDLRASGEIEEHADVVGLLYRPNYYDQRSTEVRNSDPAALDRMDRRKYDLDLGLDKNRLGPTMAVRLWCDVGRSAVDNARRDY